MKREMKMFIDTDEGAVTLTMPCDEDEINALADKGNPQWVRFVSDFEWLDFDDMDTLEAARQLNKIAVHCKDFNDEEYTKFLAVCRFEHAKTIDDVISCLDSYDEYDFDPEINTYEDYLEAYLQMNDDDMFLGAPESCAHEVGRMILTAHGGSLTEFGVMAPVSEGLYDRLDESILEEAAGFIERAAAQVEDMSKEIMIGGMTQ